jgi:hypothetical protein
MEEEASQSGPVGLRFTRLAKPIEYGYNDSNLPLPLAVVTSWVVFSCSTVSVGLSFVNGNLHMYSVLVWEDNTSPNSVVLVRRPRCSAHTTNCTCTSLIPTRDTYTQLYSFYQ